MIRFSLPLIALLLLSACGTSEPNSLTSSGEETALEHAKKHLDPKYVCPMHPQIIRDEPGNCPICGMTLVKKVVEPEPPETALEHAKKHLDPKYVCPMHPQIIRDEPGNCPICGMTLVKKTLKPAVDKYPTVTIRPEIIQRMGVRTTTVKRGTLLKYIKTVGYVTYNQDRLVHVHPRSSGWVDKLYVRKEGDPVEQNQPLLEMYSPEVLEAQQDFLVSLRTGSQGTGINNQQYRDMIRNRLRLLNVPDSTIQQIERHNQSINNVPILAPQSGIVTSLNIRDGMYVTPNLEMFAIVDLSTVWVMVEVFEHQLDWVKTGLSAEIKVAALPNQQWQGEVDYVYPQLDPKTRTLQVRLRFDNPKMLLKPNMFAQVVIHGDPKRDTLKIPQPALIVTGERYSVILALGEGRFQPVDVKTGMQSQDEIEILSGLKAGDQVVLSGQFLIDSEANLQASFLRLSDTE